MNNKIIQTEWRSGIDTVGIVLCQLATGKFRAYIGVAKTGEDEEVDAQHIASYGAKLRFHEAVGFFPRLVIGEYADEVAVGTYFDKEK